MEKRLCSACEQLIADAQIHEHLLSCRGKTRICERSEFEAHSVQCHEDDNHGYETPRAVTPSPQVPFDMHSSDQSLVSSRIDRVNEQNVSLLLSNDRRMPVR